MCNEGNVADCRVASSKMPFSTVKSKGIIVDLTDPTAVSQAFSLCSASALQPCSWTILAAEALGTQKRTCSTTAILLLTTGHFTAIRARPCLHTVRRALAVRLLRCLAPVGALQLPDICCCTAAVCCCTLRRPCRFHLGWSFSFTFW